MLRTLILVTLLAASIDSARAAERITVTQLQQSLATTAPSSTPSDASKAMLQDDALALQIDGLQLSERLTSATLESILKEQAFGPQTERAMALLADQSALLDSPASERPELPVPDANEQKRMLDAARVFVFQTLSHLPNFFATRTTAHFYGITPELNKTGLPMRIGLHPRGTSSREITYRSGKEFIEPMKVQRSESTLPQNGLESWGEFGPEPAVVLIGADAGTIAFHHWEQSQTGLVAVLRYAVPEDDSHYEVNYACNGSTSFHTEPGYHGSLAIDPASGAILRITLEADWKDGDPVSHVSSVIEYGSVEIGGRSYICPLHSLAFTVEELNSCNRRVPDQRLGQPTMRLNRTTFSDYHWLGSTSRMVTGASANDEEPHR